jgi:hypothetical protein
MGGVKTIERVVSTKNPALKRPGCRTPATLNEKTHQAGSAWRAEEMSGKGAATGRTRVVIDWARRWLAARMAGNHVGSFDSGQEARGAAGVRAGK